MRTAGYPYQYHQQQQQHPPASSSNAAPPSSFSSNAAAAAASPMAPVPPPTKKQRSTTTNNTNTVSSPPLSASETRAIDEMVDDGIKKRRDELRRLQEKAKQTNRRGAYNTYSNKNKTSNAPAFRFGAGAASSVPSTNTTATAAPPIRKGGFPPPRAVPVPVNAAMVPPSSAYARTSIIYQQQQQLKHRPAPTPSTKPPPTRRTKPSSSPTSQPSHTSDDGNKTAEGGEGNAYLAKVLNGDEQTEDDLLVTPMKPFPSKTTSRYSNDFGAAAAKPEPVPPKQQNIKEVNVARRLELDGTQSNALTQQQQQSNTDNTAQPTLNVANAPPIKSSSSTTTTTSTPLSSSNPPPTNATFKQEIKSPPDSLLKAANRALQQRKTTPITTKPPLKNMTVANTTTPAPQLIQEEPSSNNIAGITSPPDSVFKAADQALKHEPPTMDVSQKPIQNQEEQNTREEEIHEEEEQEVPPPSKKEVLRRMRQVADTPVKQQQQQQTSETTSKPNVIVTTKTNQEHENGGTSSTTTSSTNSTHLRLLKELNAAKEETSSALRDVARLESELAHEKSSKKSSSSTKKQKNDKEEESSTMEEILAHVLKLAKQDGEKAALQYAQAALHSKKSSNTSATSATLSTPTRSRYQPSFADAARSAGLTSPPALSILSSGSKGRTVVVQPRSPSPTATSSSSGAAGFVGRRRSTTPFPKRRTTFVELGLDFAQEDSYERNTTYNENEEGAIMEYLIEAARATPEEYGSDIASYFVRKPYLSSSNKMKKNDDTEKVSTTGAASAVPWEEYGVSNADNYIKEAKVTLPETLEVMATVAADGSVLILHGISNVKRGTPRWGVVVPNNGKSGGGSSSSRPVMMEWEDFCDVDDGVGRGLGCVNYVDRDGSEREYLLDKIFEEAIAVRSAYCSSLLSAASALEGYSRIKPMVPSSPVGVSAQGPPMEDGQMNVGHVPPMMGRAQNNIPPMMGQGQNNVPPMMGPNNQPSPLMMQGQLLPESPTKPQQQRMNKPNSMNMPPKAQNTMPPMGNTNAQSDANKGPPAPSAAVQPEAKKVKKVARTKPPLAQAEEAPNANDILVSMIGYLFSFVFSIIWFFLVRVPLKLLSWTIMLCLMSAIMLVIWICVADDHGASSLGAGIDFGFNQRGIF